MDVYFVVIRMLQTDKESLPDDELYDLVIGMLLLTDQIDATLKYIDLTLKFGYILSVNVFTECVRNCVNKGRLDTLVSIIERYKNKALCPPRNLCNYIADVAMEEDSSELPVLLSVDEGLVVSAIGTTGRMYTAKLLDGSWVILKRVLCQKKVPNPESYLAKIYERWTTRVMTRSSPWLESTNNVLKTGPVNEPEKASGGRVTGSTVGLNRNRTVT
ncbi:hypothetical protein HYC85_020715 [Camellia sinensis]|uniref:Pentatricopeptide repeat-containing protein n=1 Tax=Camellia sinensis TaxID=4442 RepID=A0A7J7GQK8_CAMSI|nr:hypothetical protein HYC85_020715 [Camellia sinensis]